MCLAEVWTFVTAAEKYRKSQHQMCNFDAMEFEAILKHTHYILYD